MMIRDNSCWVQIKDKLSSESELFTGDMSKDNHSPGPEIRVARPLALPYM